MEKSLQKFGNKSKKKRCSIFRITYKRFYIAIYVISAKLNFKREISLSDIKSIDALPRKEK